MEFLWTLLFSLGCIGASILIGKLWHKLSLDKECYYCRSFRYADCNPTAFSADKCKENNFCYFKHYKMKKKLWIARNESGELILFTAYPNKSALGYFLGGRRSLTLNEDDFPEITFENSPQQVELKLCNKK